jgi:hypothetical protein
MANDIADGRQCRHEPGQGEGDWALKAMCDRGGGLGLLGM